MPQLTRADRRLVATSAVFFASQALMVRILGPAAPTVGKIQTAPGARAYRRALAELDDDGRDAYRRHYHWDLVHPATFAVALHAGVDAWSTRADLSPRARTALVAAPYVSAAADYAENAIGLYLLDHPDRIADPIVRTGTAVSTLKWVLGIGTFAYLARGFLGHWGRAARARWSR